jgi:hypothetical protein
MLRSRAASLAATSALAWRDDGDSCESARGRGMAGAAMGSSSFSWSGRGLVPDTPPAAALHRRASLECHKGTGTANQPLARLLGNSFAGRGMLHLTWRS